MQLASNANQEASFLQNGDFYNSKFFSSLVFEKIIIGINAICEGIGVSGIITAALWYATAPMAPDGFNGPIATVTIIISTIASIIAAIPIAYHAYKKYLATLTAYKAELLNLTKHFDDNIEELYFDLLRFRVLCKHDTEFFKCIKPLLKSHNIELNVVSVCSIYSNFKNKYFSIHCDSDFNLSLCEDNSFQAMPFIELFKKNALMHTKAFRRAIISLVFNFIVNSEFKRQKTAHTKQSGSIGAAFVAGFTCTEVLLSIGWTVASILIGVKMMMPITTYCWLLFIFLCVAVGPLIGFGTYFNKLKQHKRELLKHEINNQNDCINQVRHCLDSLLARRWVEHKPFAQDYLHQTVKRVSCPLNY